MNTSDDRDLSKGKPLTDPAQSGAKPATLSAGEWGLFGFAADPAASALLARNWWAIGLRGVFAILFGVIALLLPGVTIGALVLLFAAYMLVDGIFDILAALRAARHAERWGWLLLEGIVDLAAGIIAIAWPAITALAFVFLLAAWAIVSGVTLLGATFRLQVTHGKWLMALGGAVSVIWGFLLFWQPLIGAVVLIWWIGAYALFFGGALLVLAYQLRLRHRQHSGAAAQRV
jgi:uncharacterized membrane protein HdeD (DUF308 family)